MAGMRTSQVMPASTDNKSRQRPADETRERSRQTERLAEYTELMSPSICARVSTPRTCPTARAWGLGLIRHPHRPLPTPESTRASTSASPPVLDHFQENYQHKLPTNGMSVPGRPALRGRLGIARSGRLELAMRSRSACPKACALLHGSGTPTTARVPQGAAAHRSGSDHFAVVRAIDWAFR